MELSEAPKPGAPPPLPSPFPDIEFRPLQYVLPLIVAGIGVWLVWLGSAMDQRAAGSFGWGRSILLLDERIEAPEGVPVRVRYTPIADYPFQSALSSGITAEMGESGYWALGVTEPVILANLPQADLESLLASGRLPEPGKAEALSGDLAAFDEIELEGVRVEVVGRIRQDAPALYRSYLLADEAWSHPLFEDAIEAKLIVEGESFLEARAEELMPLARQAARPLVNGRSRIGFGALAACFIGLVLVAAAGALLQVRALRWLSCVPGFRSFGRSLSEEPALLWGLHVFHYSVLFGFMLLAYAFPSANALAMEFVAAIFRDPAALGDIGAAYESGRVWSAAYETWENNYVRQTVLFMILPSLIVPFWGVLKNAASFALAGFIMAPLWRGVIDGFWFHSITLTLELEVYVLASYLVSLYALRIFRALFMPAKAVNGTGIIAALAGGTIVCGLLLASAGLYEALTLIVYGKF